MHSGDDVDKIFAQAKKNPEGQEHWGWHKVGWVLCLLLTALL